MIDVCIEPKSENGKGRTFRAVCLATVEADGLWAGGMTNTDDIRPVWAMFAGSENEMRPFMANLIVGRKALTPQRSWGRRKDGTRIEVLRSAKFQTTWQKEIEGTISTVFYPDLFRLDPGMVDPQGIQFVVLPSREWVAKQHVDVGPVLKHLAKFSCPLKEDQLAALVPISYLFAAYLDRRTRCPLLADGRFYAQLLIACLSTGYASWSSDESYYREAPFGVHRSLGFREVGTSDVGLLPGIAFRSNHEQIEKLLAEQVTLFFEATK